MIREREREREREDRIDRHSVEERGTYSEEREKLKKGMDRVRESVRIYLCCSVPTYVGVYLYYYVSKLVCTYIAVYLC